MNAVTLPFAILFGLKALVLLGIGVYSVFAVVMIQQTKLMSSVLEDPFEGVLQFISLFHLAAAVGLFLLALILL